MTQNSHNTQHTTITVPQPNAPKTLKDITFGSAAKESVTLPILKDPYLKWFNGATTDQRTLAYGWHIDAGLDPYLDETLEGMGMQRYVVDHRTADRDGNTQKPYWHVHPCSLIFVAEGALSVQQMDRSEQRTGFAFAREMELDKNKQPVRYDDGQRNIKRHMVLKLRVFIHELVKHGYTEYLPLVLNGNIVYSMIEALARQGDVLKAFYGYTGERAPFFGFSLPLVASETRKMVGVPPAQSPIYPMLAALPATIDEAYLLDHAVPEELATRISEDLLGETMIWSYTETDRMRAIGQEFVQPSALDAASSSISATNAHSTARTLPSAPADPLLQKPQIDWITMQYCQNNQDLVRQVCAYFHVEALEQLKMSQFRELVDAKKQEDEQASEQPSV